MCFFFPEFFVSKVENLQKLCQTYTLMARNPSIIKLVPWPSPAFAGWVIRRGHRSTPIFVTNGAIGCWYCFAARRWCAQWSFQLMLPYRFGYAFQRIWTYWKKETYWMLSTFGLIFTNVSKKEFSQVESCDLECRDLSGILSW